MVTNVTFEWFLTIMNLFIICQFNYQNNFWLQLWQICDFFLHALLQCVLLFAFWQLLKSLHSYLLSLVSCKRKFHIVSLLSWTASTCFFNLDIHGVLLSVKLIIVCVRNYCHIKTRNTNNWNHHFQIWIALFLHELNACLCEKLQFHDNQSLG